MPLGVARLRRVSRLRSTRTGIGVSGIDRLPFSLACPCRGREPCRFFCRHLKNRLIIKTFPRLAGSVELDYMIAPTASAPTYTRTSIRRLVPRHVGQSPKLCMGFFYIGIFADPLGMPLIFDDEHSGCLRPPTAAFHSQVGHQPQKCAVLHHSRVPAFVSALSTCGLKRSHTAV